MAIDFQNPLTAGTVLIRSDVRSQNYSPGTAGWIIEANGDAEFNNLVIRGTFQGTNFILNTNGMFFYDPAPGTGNLIASIAPIAGTDAYGNPYLRGIASYDSTGPNSRLTGGQLLIAMKDDPNFPFFPVNGGIGVLFQSRGMSIISPSNGTFNHAANMALNAGSTLTQGATTYPNVEITCDGWIDGAWRSSANNTPETWHAFPFSGTWAGATVFNAAPSATWASMRYRKDAEDNLWIEGLAQSSSTSGTIGTLPAGYFNPNHRAFMPANFNAPAGTPGSGFVQITETGVVNSSTSLGGKAITSGSQIYINAKIPLGNLT